MRPGNPTVSGSICFKKTSMNHSKRIPFLLVTVVASLTAAASPLLDSIGAGRRIFIAHRGVNLRSTIAGENSTEAIALASRAGFDAIETDVRLTADDSLVIMHDATLNRTCLNSDGSEIKDKTPVENVKWNDLRNRYILKADSESNRSKIPSLKEYLEVCKRNNLLVFIEPKLTDETGRYYRRIIKTADEVLGRGNYIITSNNRANEIIRDSLGVVDIPLMGILYQTTFDRIERLGNVIMAVSATRFSKDDYAANISKSKQNGLLRESHADKFKHFDMINHNDVNIISTDFLAPDNDSLEGETLLDVSETDLFGSPIEFCNAGLKPVEFGALYIEFDIEGDATVTLGRQKFEVTDGKKLRHQVMLYNEIPTFSIDPESGSVRISDLKLKLIKF